MTNQEKFIEIFGIDAWRQMIVFSGLAGDLWKNKSVVTDEAIKAVAQFLIEHDETFKFAYKDKDYYLLVKEKESKE